MTTRSTQLGYDSGTGAGALVTFFTAPAGYRAVLKDLTMYVSPSFGAIGVTIAGSGPTIQIAAGTNALVVQYQRFLVLNPADELVHFITSGSAFQIVAAGALLPEP